MNWLARLLGGGTAAAERPEMDYGLLGTDVHSHLIPGVDDGAPNLEATLTLLRGFAELGYRRVITTPHIHALSYPNRAEDLRERHAALVALPEVKATGIAIELAAEYFLDEHFLELLQRDELLTFAGRHVLIETHHQQRNLSLERLVEELTGRGYVPVLAHPERYAYGWANPQYFLPLRAQGLRLQVNITAFSGHYGKQILHTAEQLAKWDAVDLLGSDCHKPEHQQLLRRALAHPQLQRLLHSPVVMNRAL